MTVSRIKQLPFERAVSEFESLLRLGGVNASKINIAVPVYEWEGLVRMINSQTFAEPYEVTTTKIEFCGLRFICWNV